MTCPACAHQNRDGARFCAQCGAELAGERMCPSCGAGNPAAARFCDACGTALSADRRDDPRTYTPDHLVTKLREAGTALDGERKQVTVMFADVLGSMDLAEQTDPEAWRAIMDRFFAHLCEGVHRFEGTVVQFTGDGIMALFGAPIAHEDHAVRAAYSALHLQRDLSEYAAELRRERGLSFSVRLGLNSGEVVVGGIGDDLRVDYTAIGHTVGLAQRMESLAEPGRAYVTEHTAALLDGYFELRDLGPFEVKGVREPVHVSELLAPGSARTRLDRSRARGYSRFVGRHAEMAVLEEALERALTGDGNVVALVGEPGVGKSRLCDEFVQRCDARDVPVFSAAGAAHARNVPFHAAFEMLRGYFGVDEQDSAQVQRERIAGRLLLLDPAFGDDLPLIFDLMGIADPDRPLGRIDPDARQRRLIDAVKRLVAAHSARQPIVNLVEDLHWIDGASHLLLEALVEAAPGRRTLVVVNQRPEYEADWLDLPHVTTVALVPLGEEAIEALLTDLVGDDDGVARLKERIRQTTGGNPFFIEEVVRAFVEDGTLAGRRGDHRLTREAHSVSVPPSVHAVLAARIDRLAREDKALLQAAAVIGREFGERVLERVAREVLPADLDLALSLRDLVDADFVYQTEAFPEAEYAFKHPLTQEVAYGSQLGERRRTVHAAVAMAIAELHPDRLDERSALLALHWERAGEALDAARWHARAAAWAGINHQGEAMRHWRKVLELADKLPETAETLSLGVAARLWVLQFGWRRGMPRAESDAMFEQGRRLAERTGDDGMVALLLASYGGALGTGGEVGPAAALAKEAGERAERAGSAVVEMAVMPFLSYTQFLTGEYADAIATLDRAIELGEADPTLAAGMTLKSPYAWAFFLRGSVNAVMGRAAEAAADTDRALELAQRYEDLETMCWIHMNRSFIGFWTGEFEGLVETVSRSVDIAEAIGSAFSLVWAHFCLGCSANMVGDLETASQELELARELVERERTGLECEPWIVSWLSLTACERGDPAAVSLAREAIDMALARGLVNVRPLAYIALARALRVTAGGPNDLEEAWAALDEADAAVRATGGRSAEGMVLLERAELARTAGDAIAETRFLRDAIGVFEDVGATGHVSALAPRLAPV